MEDLHGRKIIIEETERSIQTKLVYLPTMLERSPNNSMSAVREVVSKRKQTGDKCILLSCVHSIRPCDFLSKFCHLPERPSPRTVF